MVHFIWDASIHSIATSSGIMEAELNPHPCTGTAPSTASSCQPAADPCGPRVPEERHIWPTVLRTPPSRAILQPLSFPETPKEDLSLFTDPSKDQPIYCLICDQTFSCSNCDSLRKSEHLSGLAQNLVLSEPKVGHSDVGGALKADNKDVVESGEGQKRVREKEESKVLQLQPKDEWLRHLLLEHKIVIHRVSEICSLKCYSEYWRSRLATEPITKFAPVVRTNSLSTDLGPSEDYYLFSDALPEDKELRQQLQRRRLEAILEIQQAEREDSTFSHRCLFCRDVFTGNRALLFQHMLEEHSFNVGQPDNLVFVVEFLDMLQNKLDSLQCLYCERTFRDHPTLKDHMRKKQHKKINPQNKVYDRFYVINYLELGKSWEQVQSEDDRDIIHREENEWGDWEESAPSCPTHCLFCQCPSRDFHLTLQHMKASHNFDFDGVTKQLNLDYYCQVKLVNYIRRQVHLRCCISCCESFDSSEQLLSHMTLRRHFTLPADTSKWNQPQYLFPLYENDAFLFALDDCTSQTDKTVSS